MNIYTDDKNVDTLKCLIVGLYTGVKLNVQKKKPENGTFPKDSFPILEIDKTQSLFETNAICRFLANKQKKVPLFPENFEGNKVDEVLELPFNEETLLEIEKSLKGSFIIGVSRFF